MEPSAPTQPRRPRRIPVAGVAVLALLLAAAVIAWPVWLLRDRTVYVLNAPRALGSPTSAPVDRREPPPSFRDRVDAAVPLPPLPVDLSTPTANDASLADLPFDPAAVIRQLEHSKSGGNSAPPAESN